MGRVCAIGYSRFFSHLVIISIELDEYDLWDLYYQVENPMGYQLVEDRYDLVS